MDKPIGKIKNATIKRTMLGYEDHGIPTCMLYLDYGNSGRQGFGGYDLRYYGVGLITKILKIVGVDEWESLRGKNIRVDAEHSKVHGIAHYLEDKWLYPEELEKA